MGNNPYKKPTVSIPIIKEKVSIASNISVEEMEFPNRWPGARKRERVDARNISMALSKDFTKFSLATIGFHHGGRDHATVLHAHKTVGFLLDTKDLRITEVYEKSQLLIEEWINSKSPKFKKILAKKEKIYLVKTWIKNHVPLYIREQILKSIGNRCECCGNIINELNHGNRTKTVSDSLQRSYKK